MKNKNIEYIVKNGLCTSCGICAGACKQNCISFIYGKHSNIPVIEKKACTNCGRCLRACPGKGANLKMDGEYLFPNSSINDYCGRYINCYAGFSKNDYIRFHSASGGMVTSFLIYLLEKSLIDGALVIRYSKRNPFIPEPFIATTRDEIMKSRGSKYLVVSYDKIINKIKDFGKRIVVVGVPCQIQGLRNLAKIDKILEKQILGYFGIYCSCTKINSSIDYYLYRYGINKTIVNEFSFRDDGCFGFMKFSDRKGNVIKKIPYQKYWKGTRGFFVNDRCALCSDHFAELSDISFGDSDHQPYASEHIGISSIIVRNQYWEKILNLACNEHYIYLEKTTAENITDKQIYAKTYKKGKGIKATMKIRQFLGLPNPIYGDINNSITSFKDLLVAGCRMLMKKIGKFRYSWFIIKMLDNK